MNASSNAASAASTAGQCGVRLPDGRAVTRSEIFSARSFTAEYSSATANMHAHSSSVYRDGTGISDSGRIPLPITAQMRPLKA